MCGIFGIFGHPNGKEIAKTGIWALQHRGQDGAGIASYKYDEDPVRKGYIEVHKERGKVREVFQGPKYNDLEGHIFIAHVRYPTQGKPSRRNLQPHYAQDKSGKIALASNGDVVNMQEQKRFLGRYRITTYTKNDAELIACTLNYQIRERKRDMVEAIVQAMDHIKGAFSALVICEFDDRLFAFRDPYGIRPLFLACISENGTKYYMFASETCAFGAVTPLFGPKAKLELCRQVEQGEIVAVGPNGLETFSGPKAEREAFCLFEYVYFSRPDSEIFGRSFQDYRIAAGRELYKEHPTKADLISPVPKSGIPASVGYSFASGTPYIPVIIENPSFEVDFGQLRTFIESEEEKQELEAKLKYNYARDIITVKSICTTDDSIVRGLTMKIINQNLWLCRAKEIHTRIPSPPYRHSCFYGIETKERIRLVAANRTEEEVRKYINSTSLAYLSLEGLIKSTGRKKCQLCTACFDGDYPIEIPKIP